jgi:CHASE2 domain-containing sensor protein
MAIDLNAQLFPYERWEQSRAESMVFVAIDEASIQEVGQWPWDRGELARLLEHLGQSGVKAIGVDVLFLERDQRSASELCRRLAIQYPSSLLPSVATRLRSRLTSYRPL